jgi:hypothetical protein
MSRWLRAASAVAVASLVAAPGAAAVFAIHLHNGTTFETRYRPVDAEYDAGKVVFVDEMGNLVALAKADVARIESDVEVAGYGHVIDDTTIALGWAPNDAPEAGTAGDQARQAAIAAEGQAQGPAAEPIYDVENVPATMQVIPSYTPEGQPFVIPAPPPAATPATTEPPPAG